MESEIVKLIEAETGMVITWDHNLGGENGEVLVKGFFVFFFFFWSRVLKFYFYKMNKFWRYNEEQCDYSYLYCTLYLKFAK